MKKLVIIWILSIATIMAFSFSKGENRNLSGSGVTVPQFSVASSTLYTVTTSASQRILATSTLRVAASVDVYGCGATAGLVATLFLKASNDVAATANAGMAVFASTTRSFGSFPSSGPVPTGAVTAITGSGTCSALVTEWRVTN